MPCEKATSNPLGVAGLCFSAELRALVGQFFHLLIEDVFKFHLVIVQTQPVVLADLIANVVQQPVSYTHLTLPTIYSV